MKVTDTWFLTSGPERVDGGIWKRSRKILHHLLTLHHFPRNENSWSIVDGSLLAFWARTPVSQILTSGQHSFPNWSPTSKLECLHCSQNSCWKLLCNVVVVGDEVFLKANEITRTPTWLGLITHPWAALYSSFSCFLLPLLLLAPHPLLLPLSIPLLFSSSSSSSPFYSPPSNLRPISKMHVFVPSGQHWPHGRFSFTYSIVGQLVLLHSYLKCHHISTAYSCCLRIVFTLKSTASSFLWNSSKWFASYGSVGCLLH